MNQEANTLQGVGSSLKPMKFEPVEYGFQGVRAAILGGSVQWKESLCLESVLILRLIVYSRGSDLIHGAVVAKG
jgi:hypothetical protein